MMHSARQQRAHGVTNTTTLRGCRFCGSRSRLCRRPRFEKNETSTMTETRRKAMSTFVVVASSSSSSSSSPGRRQMMMTTTTTMTMTMTSPFVERERFFARAEGVPAFPDDDDDDASKTSSSSSSSCGVKSLTVGQNPGEFSTISRALEASAEEGGATISIQSGTYKERVVVNKPNVRFVGLSEDVYVEWRTSTPYESALEVATGVTNVSVENVKLTHSSKSVANNFGVFVREGGSLALRNATVTSETGSGVATEGGSIDAENVKIDKCKNHGVSAFGNQLEEPKSGKVRMENVAISNCGGDGILLRGGVQIDSVDVKIENCAGFGVEAFENVQGKIAKCKISKCKKGNVGGNNDNYDGNGVSIELA